MTSDEISRHNIQFGRRSPFFWAAPPNGLMTTQGKSSFLCFLISLGFLVSLFLNFFVSLVFHCQARPSRPPGWPPRPSGWSPDPSNPPAALWDPLNGPLTCLASLTLRPPGWPPNPLSGLPYPQTPWLASHLLWLASQTQISSLWYHRLLASSGPLPHYYNKHLKNIYDGRTLNCTFEVSNDW